MNITLERINELFNSMYSGGAGFKHTASNDRLVSDLNALGITEADVSEYTLTEEFRAHERGYHALRGLSRWYKAKCKGKTPAPRKPRAPKAEPKAPAEPKPAPAAPTAEPAPAEPISGAHERMQACLNVIKVAGRPLLMTGPAGSGKSYTAAKIATECGATEFFTQSKVCYETDLKGFMDAHQNFCPTALYRAIKRADSGEKTAYFLDEIFAGDTSCLTVINDLLSDGKMTFPNGETFSAENLIIMAADNTSGNGATNAYNTRNKADKSFLNRFGCVHIDYDRAIEEKMAQGNKELLTFIRAMRDAAEHVDIELVCSYRTIDGMAKYAAAGISAAEAIETFIYQDALTEDDKDTLRQDAKIARLIAKGNTYACAM